MKIGQKVKFNPSKDHLDKLPEFMEAGMIMEITGDEQNGAYPVCFTGTDGELYIMGIAIAKENLEVIE